MSKDKEIKLKKLLKSEHFLRTVHNKTKYRLVKTLISKYQYKKLDSLDIIESIADDVLTTLSIVGADMYGRYGDEEMGDQE